MKTGAARQAPANGMMGMMQGNMMQMMSEAMNNPLHHAAMMVQVLPTMKDPLGLSNEQVAHLEKIAGQFKQQQASLHEKVTQAEDQLAVLLENDQPDLKKVKSLLQERATYTADWQALDVETAHRMKAELTQTQRAKLAEMTPMQMYNHMATHMTMTEMMNAMYGGAMQGCMMTNMMQAGIMPGNMQAMTGHAMMNQ